MDAHILAPDRNRTAATAASRTTVLSEGSANPAIPDTCHPNWSQSSSMRTAGASETDSKEADKPPSIRTVYPSQSSPQITPKAPHAIGASSSEKVVRMAEARRESFPVGKQARAFQKRFFPDVSVADWSDWRWQLRSRIRSLAALEQVFRLSTDERDAVMRHQGLAAGRHHALLCEPARPGQPRGRAPPHPHTRRPGISAHAGRGG